MSKRESAAMLRRDAAPAAPVSNNPVAPPVNADEIVTLAGELRSNYANLVERLGTLEANDGQRLAEIQRQAQAISDQQDALTRANRPRAPQDVAMERSETQRAALAAFLRGEGTAALEACGGWKPDMAERSKGLEARQQGSSVNTTLGGYLVLPDVDTNIDRISRVYSNIRDFVRVVPIGGREYLRDVKVGKATVTWVEDDSVSEPEADTPDFKEVRIVAREARAIMQYSRTLLADAYFDLVGEVSIDLAEAYTIAEADCIINGNGIGKPKGILKYDTAEQTGRTEPAFGTIGFVKTGQTAAWGNTTDKTEIDVFQNTIARMKPEHLSGSNWFMNRTSIAQVMLFKDKNGQLLWVPSLIPGNASTLRNYPVQNIEEMPDGASGKFPAMFANLNKGYTLVDRAGMEVLVNPYRTTGKTRFESYKRIGGGVMKSEAIKLIKWAS